MFPWLHSKIYDHVFFLKKKAEALPETKAFKAQCTFCLSVCPVAGRMVDRTDTQPRKQFNIIFQGKMTTKIEETLTLKKLLSWFLFSDSVCIVLSSALAKWLIGWLNGWLKFITKTHFSYLWCSHSDCFCFMQFSKINSVLCCFQHFFCCFICCQKPC